MPRCSARSSFTARPNEHVSTGADTLLMELFNDALALKDEEERARFLEKACGGNHDLRQRIEKLLLAEQQAGGFLGNPSKPGESQKPQLTEKPGDQIGRYKLLQQIGEGGCGV